MVMPQPLHIISHDLQDTITTTPPEVPRRRVFSTKCVDDSVRSESGPNSPVSPKSHQVPICTGSTSNPSLPTSPVQQSTVLQSSRSRSKSWKSLPSMASNHGQGVLEQEKHSLLQDSPLGSSRNDSRSSPRDSLDSTTTVSTTSLVLENLNANAEGNRGHARKPLEPFEYRDDESDPEIPPPAHVAKWREQSFSKGTHASMSQTLKRLIWVIGIIAVSGWAVALFALLSKKTYQHASNLPYDHETPSKSHGRMITLEDVQHGQWWTHHVNLNWIPGPNGEDGLLLEVQQPGKDFMVVEDVRSRKGETGSDVFPAKTLMKYQGFNLRGSTIPILAEDYWVSPDLTKVLILTRREKVYRHSFTGIYYILDVATQLAEVLDPNVPDGRVQLATWSPKGNSVVFTRENNLFVRLLKDSAGEDTTAVRQVTTDGGSEYFYGIPDWVYEEEVFENNIATWWDREGRFVAFLRTNETMVPEYSISYYVSRPSGLQPEKGMENYPDEKRIKYPKAGAPNPVVDMLFYDLQANEVFEVDIDDGFADNDRIIGDVLWADDGKVLVKEVNRVSDKIRVVLVDVNSRTGKQVRKTDVRELDGGWVEPGQESQYVPADPANGRDQDGYIDLVIHDNGDHLGYFSPIDSAEPLMLTSGPWEVEKGTVNLDLKNNLVYFSASKEHSTQRHIYSVDLSGKGIKPIVPTDKPGYYTASFSAQSLYAILNYEGPGIPSQKLVSTPANPNTYSEILEENKDLAKKAASHEMPHLVYTNMTAEDGTVLNILEQRPPHFDPNQQYPVLFQLYGGPGSQSVTRRFSVNFQSYVASSLGYLVVTLDNRGTGFIGRKARTLVRGNLGRIEATDQIAAAKMYAAKKYVDVDRLAIWGWSYGGFMTLKVLEMDAGQTFRYGMAVAPVTDWADYDSVYTERYMLTPQENPSGYADTAISNVTALSHNVRWLMMHGTGDDNVHVQNTLQLIDKLDLEGIKNYDVHFFPDSDHGIYFHGANEVVYGKLNAFLINAFNGEFYKMNNPTPDYVAGIDG